MSSASHTIPSGLHGRRVLVSAYDLEQGEHRGIAVFSKALIRCLHDAGAEVWLLTGFSPVLKGRGRQLLPRKARSLIQMSVILDSLAYGRQTREQSFLERRFRWARFLIAWRNRILLLKVWLSRPRRYRSVDMLQMPLAELDDNPYLRMERLSYLQDVTGIVSAPGIYLASQSAAMLAEQIPVTIDCSGFDALLTTCPLNLLALNVPVFVQSVHDLIPLEFFAHNENQVMFSHRLQACLPGGRLFVSEATARKFRERILQPELSRERHKAPRTINHQERVVVQPPSLRFPRWLLTDPDRVGDLKPASYLLRPHPEDPDPTSANQGWAERPINQRSRRMLPFRYLLFNSSVEARKNLFLLAEAYAESNLSAQGIHLCVTGKLKNDDYSAAVKSIVRHEPGILLTGYVDESTKRDLYLNALALLSPSLVEGFGIPVLDAACLGMPSLVSDSASHLEIAALHDFDATVLPLSTLSSRDWADAMSAQAALNRTLWQSRRASVERRRRISRYEKLRLHFYSQLQSDLTDVLISN